MGARPLVIALLSWLSLGGRAAAQPDVETLVAVIEADPARLPPDALRATLADALGVSVIGLTPAADGRALGTLSIAVDREGRRVRIHFRTPAHTHTWGGGEVREAPADLMAWVVEQAVAVVLASRLELPEPSAPATVQAGSEVLDPWAGRGLLREAASARGARTSRSRRDVVATTEVLDPWIEGWPARRPPPPGRTAEGARDLSAPAPRD